MLSNLESGLKTGEMFESADIVSEVYRRLKVDSAMLSVPLSGTVNAINYLKNCV